MDMYRQQIMDHFKSPRNFGKLPDANINFTDHNPFCGDEITIHAKIKEEQIEEVKFEGKGCAISQASASMLTEIAKGKTFEEVRSIKSEQIKELLGVDLGPVRIKCALLGLKALQKGIIEFLLRKNSGV